MSRGASVFGFLLGVVSVAAGLRADSVSTGWGVGAGILLLALVVFAWRGHLLAQGAMSALGLVLLARFLPVYFQTPGTWWVLALVILGSITFGLGVLGVLLDRYRPPGKQDGSL
jgi:hypothetical protein